MKFVSKISMAALILVGLAVSFVGCQKEENAQITTQKTDLGEGKTVTRNGKTFITYFPKLDFVSITAVPREKAAAVYQAKNVKFRYLTGALTASVETWVVGKQRWLTAEFIAPANYPLNYSNPLIGSSLYASGDIQTVINDLKTTGGLKVLNQAAPASAPVVATSGTWRVPSVSDFNTLYGNIGNQPSPIDTYLIDTLQLWGNAGIWSVYDKVPIYADGTYSPFWLNSGGGTPTFAMANNNTGKIGMLQTTLTYYMSLRLVQDLQ